MSRSNTLRILVFAVAASLVAAFSTAVSAKSMYVIANINANPTPLETYDIQLAPTYLVFQATAGVPALAGGAVGLALDDASAKLFVTYEVSNTIQLVDATTFAVLSQTTAPGASNLAGIVVDQGNNKVYTVDRETDHLFVYSWTSATNTLTLDGGAFKTLTGVSRAGGLALDEIRGRLYVGDRDSTTVRYFDTATFTGATILTEAGNVDISAEGQNAMGIAIDQVRNILYTGNPYGPWGSLGKLVKHDLNTSTTTAFTLPGAPVGGSSTGDNIVGVAVDEDTGNVYTTTGNAGTGGTDTIIVFDSSLAVLKNDFGGIGNPTGIAIPRAQVSFNPLNFTKVGSPNPVASGSDLTYTLCYDNTANATPVNNVVITDVIPAGTTYLSDTGPSSQVGNTITWSISSVAAGAAQVCYNLVVNVTASDGTTIVNSATIDSDETPPTTQTESTLVGTGNGGGIIFAGKGEGGSGSTGPLELLIGLFGLPLLLARRSGRHVVRRTLAGVLIVIFGATLATAAVAADKKWYVGAGAGQAETDVSASDYDAALAGKGYTTSSSIDDSDTGWKLFGGYELTRNWAVEGAYVDLGEVTSSTLVSSPPLPTAVEQQQFVDDAAPVHPYSVDGFSLVGKGTWPVNDRFSVFAKLGIFIWEADILVRCVGCATQVSSPDDESGTDWTGGVGAGYDFSDDLGIRFEYERFATDRDDVDFLSASVLYRF
jgi:OOP family OmpA-OmpF porin